MRQIRSDRIITGAVLGALPLLLAGCSFSFGGPPAVPADEVAQESSRMLAEEIGQTPDEVTCDEDLPAEVDAEIRCELTDNGVTYGVTITTTSVEDDNVEWDIVVDTEPTEGSADGTESTEGEAAGEGDGASENEDEQSDHGTSAVVSDVVEEESSRMLAEEIGQTPDSFTCDENLPAEVGSEIRCELTDNGVAYGVTITTTSVQGTNVDWDIQVDETPL